MTTVKLNTGAYMPIIALGTFQAQNKEETYNGVSTALKLGYRHIDTAAVYHNEEEIGRAIRDSGVPREEIFLTTKLPDHQHTNPEAGLNDSLERLGLDYVDLYLIHWPFGVNPNGNHPTDPTLPNGGIDFLEDWDFIDTYKLMQQLPQSKAKAIGVSNFSIKNLQLLLKDPEVVTIPAANQVELHPHLCQIELIEYCKQQAIVPAAYMPLGGSGGPLTRNKTIIEISERYGVPAASILINWALWRGTTVLPKSFNPARLKTNLQHIKLSDSDGELINEISQIEGTHRYCAPEWKKALVFNDL